MTIDPRYCPSEDPRNPANDTGPECPDCGASLGDEVECEACAQPDPDREPECWGVGSLEHETNQCWHHNPPDVGCPLCGGTGVFNGEECSDCGVPFE